MKTKKISAGVYEIVGTSLVISKDEPPHFGCPQEWSIGRRESPEVPLLTGKSREHALDCLRQLLAACDGLEGY